MALVRRRGAGQRHGICPSLGAGHGEVTAQRRRPQQHYGPGTRAYLSAGLPGADWWVAGRAVDQAGDADVELGEVARLYTEHDLWDSAFG